MFFAPHDRSRSHHPGDAPRRDRRAHHPDLTRLVGWRAMKAEADIPGDRWEQERRWALRMGPTDGLLFLRLNNVGNELAYNATSIATVRPLAPLPGRGLMLGLRLSF